MDMKRILCGLLLLAALRFCSSTPLKDFLEPSLECWEECFSEYNDSLTDYQQFFTLGQQVRGMRLMGGHNATAFLLDSSIDIKRSTKIFSFQKNLAVLLTMMIPNGVQCNPFYASLFNDVYAWSCDSWQRLGRCEAVEQIEQYMNQDELSFHQSDEGRIEDACYLASKRMKDPTGSCSDKIFNPMAVALINSPMDKSDFNGGQSACSDHFSSRFVVGTHKASKSQMQKWSSSENGIFKIDQSTSSSDALERLTECMKVSISSTSYKKLFCTKVFCSAFLLLHFGFVIFC